MCRYQAHVGVLHQLAFIHRGGQPINLLSIAWEDDGGTGGSLPLVRVSRHHEVEEGSVTQEGLRGGCNGKGMTGRRRSGVDRTVPHCAPLYRTTEVNHAV